MLKNLLQKEEGFTLIEIVLVLAIAGLIMVIVFLALNGAQRARRDTQRKQDAAQVLTAVETCAANSGGVYTTCIATGGSAVVGTGKYFSANDPSGTAYAALAALPAGAWAAGNVFVSAAACGSHSGVTAAVRMYQEASANVPFCVDNGQ